jgi:O-antigen biosynthesis protein
MSNRAGGDTSAKTARRAGRRHSKKPGRSRLPAELRWEATTEVVFQNPSEYSVCETPTNARAANLDSHVEANFRPESNCEVEGCVEKEVAQSPVIPSPRSAANLGDSALCSEAVGGVLASSEHARDGGHDPETARFQGHFEGARGGWIEGWVLNLADPNDPSIVEVFADGQLIAEIAASLFRQDLADASIGVARHGFRVPVPVEILDGREHVLTAQVRGSDFVLTGSPCSFQLPSTDFVGRIERLSGDQLIGWAFSYRNPEISPRLNVFVDGASIGEFECNGLRSAKDDLLTPVGAWKFSIGIPGKFLDGAIHVIRILFEDGNSALCRRDTGEISSEFRFAAEAGSSITGVVDGLQGELMRGWAVRRAGARLEGSVSVQVLCDGIAVDDIVADRPRVDVARELGCDPLVGFDYRLPKHCRNGSEFEFTFIGLPEGQMLSGCPILAKYRSPDDQDQLKALAENIDELCAKAFKLQRQMRQVLPAADATILNYDSWARRYLANLRTRVHGRLDSDRPLVSIIMPVYRTNLTHLASTIESVLAQSYQNWELIIVDDGSDQPSLRTCLESYASCDRRIRCYFNLANGGISKASNQALQRATGKYIVFLDHDDLLVDEAIEVLLSAALNTGGRLVYADEDKIDEFGVLSEPALKPDWNYRLLLSINYICHPVLIHGILLQSAGWLRPELDGAQDHDLLLRLCEKCEPGEIIHVPEILYHWRKSASSTALSGQAKPYAVEAGRRAVFEHLQGRGFTACDVSPLGRSTTFQVKWGFTDQPAVTVIIPFKDQIKITRRCVEALLSNTQWENWRLVLVDNGSVSDEAINFCETVVLDSRVSVMRVEESFNFSRLNNLAVRAQQAEYVVFMNNDVFVESGQWLRIMVDEALADPKVAIVGAKLLYPDRTVQHAGVILGVGGVADHVFRGIPSDDGGYLSRANCAQQYSAVTAACMLCRTEVFIDVGGFDEHQLKVAFNDVDLCLKVGSRGWKVVWTPDHVIEHHESLSRGDDFSSSKAPRFFYENHIMLERWHEALSRDPFYNLNFSREGGTFLELR